MNRDEYEQDLQRKLAVALDAMMEVAKHHQGRTSEPGRIIREALDTIASDAPAKSKTCSACNGRRVYVDGPSTPGLTHCAFCADTAPDAPAPADTNREPGSLSSADLGPTSESSPVKGVATHSQGESPEAANVAMPQRGPDRAPSSRTRFSSLAGPASKPLVVGQRYKLGELPVGAHHKQGTRYEAEQFPACTHFVVTEWLKKHYPDDVVTLVSLPDAPSAKADEVKACQGDWPRGGLVTEQRSAEPPLTRQEVVEMIQAAFAAFGVSPGSIVLQNISAALKEAT